MSTINIQIIQYLIKIYIHANKQENVTHSHKKSIEIGPEFSEVLESTEKLLRAIVNIFKDLKKIIHKVRREIEPIKKRTKWNFWS